MKNRDGLDYLEELDEVIDLAINKIVNIVAQKLKKLLIAVIVLLVVLGGTAVALQWQSGTLNNNVHTLKNNVSTVNTKVDTMDKNVRIVTKVANQFKGRINQPLDPRIVRTLNQVDAICKKVECGV